MPRRAVKAGNHSFTPQYQHDFKQARRYGLTGQRHARSVNQQSRFNAFLFRQGP
jgi:hypothetical protein